MSFSYPEQRPTATVWGYHRSSSFEDWVDFYSPSSWRGCLSSSCPRLLYLFSCWPIVSAASSLSFGIAGANLHQSPSAGTEKWQLLRYLAFLIRTHHRALFCWRWIWSTDGRGNGWAYLSRSWIFLYGSGRFFLNVLKGSSSCFHLYSSPWYSSFSSSFLLGFINKYIVRNQTTISIAGWWLYGAGWKSLRTKKRKIREGSEWR